MAREATARGASPQAIRTRGSHVTHDMARVASLDLGGTATQETALPRNRDATPRPCHRNPYVGTCGNDPRHNVPRDPHGTPRYASGYTEFVGFGYTQRCTTRPARCHVILTRRGV